MTQRNEAAFLVGNTGAPGGPVFPDGIASIFDRVAERPCGVTENRVSVLVEDHDLVIAEEDFFAALMIKQDHIVSTILFIVDDHVRAALANVFAISAV